MSVTDERLFDVGEVTVVRLPATAMVFYGDRKYYREGLPKRPRKTWVALDLEALIMADLEWWEGGDLRRVAGDGGNPGLRVTLMDLALHHVARQEASGAPFAEWPAVVAWQGCPMPEATCDIQVDDVAVRKALAFELARRPRTPVDELALIVSAQL